MRSASLDGGLTNVEVHPNNSVFESTIIHRCEGDGYIIVTLPPKFIFMRVIMVITSLTLPHQ